MNKLSVKIILTLFLVFLVTAIVPRAFMQWMFEEPASEIIDSHWFLIGVSATAFLSVTLFGIAINWMIVKRIRKLSEATRQIATGKFNVVVDDCGKDELAELSGNFNRMTEELRSNEFLSKEFVRNFSHEFKTPISAIRGYAELLALGNLSDAERNEYAGIIVEESDRLSHLSKNMLQLSMIDAKSILPQTDTFHLIEQIRRVLQTLQFAWEAKNLEIDIEGEELDIVSNREFTHQIWHNLLENAIIHSPEQGVIRIRVAKADDAIVVTVSDQGKGIPLEDQARIFQLFFVAGRGSKQGHGVGLSITKRIVEKLGGSIAFQSSEQDGTAFSIRLPQNPQPNA